MKRKKKVMEVISLGVYPFDVLFTVGTSRDEIIECLERIGPSLSGEELDALNFPGNGKTVQMSNKAFVLWLKTQSVPVLSHEIFHVAELLMDTIKTPLNSSTSEPYAYLIEFLTRRSLAIMPK